MQGNFRVSEFGESGELTSPRLCAVCSVLVFESVELFVYECLHFSSYSHLVTLKCSYFDLKAEKQIRIYLFSVFFFAIFHELCLNVCIFLYVWEPNWGKLMWENNITSDHIYKYTNKNWRLPPSMVLCVQVCGFPAYITCPLLSSSLLSCHPSCCYGDCLGATDTSMSCWAALMLIGPDGDSFVPVCSPEAQSCHRTTWEGELIQTLHFNTFDHPLRFGQLLFLHMFLICAAF